MLPGGAANRLWVDEPIEQAAIVQIIDGGVDQGGILLDTVGDGEGCLARGRQCQDRDRGAKKSVERFQRWKAGAVPGERDKSHRLSG